MPAIERYEQSDGERICWPHLESAEDLPSLHDKLYKALYLYDIRRTRNMPPPTIREVGKYVGTDSSSMASYYVKKLVDAGFLTKHEDKVSAASRSMTIRVNFATVKRISDQEVELPEVKGLTSPK